MKKLIFVILLISLTIAGYSQTITSLGVSGAYYDIKTDNTGAVHIIWIDLQGWAHYGQIVNRQVVNQVTIPGLARNEINYRKFRPRIAVRPDGNEVHFTWVTPSSYPTQFMHAWKNSSGIWNRETIYSAPSNTYFEYPAITIDSAGVAHASCITWKDGVSAHAVIYLRKAAGGSWVRQTDISAATTKQLWITMFTDPSGNVHMTWDSNDKRYINYRTAPSGGNLASSSTTTLGTNWDHNKESDVFVDSSGNVHVAALSYNDPGSYVGFDYWNKPVGAGFSSPVSVTPSQFYVSRYFPHPVVIGNSASLAAVSWAEGVLGTPMTIRVATYDGNSWTQYQLDDDANFNEWSKTALALNSTTAFCIWRGSDKTISLATFDFASAGLISPNGGEEWGFSKTYDIKWNLDNATGNVDINLFKNDIDLGPIVSDIADSGSYSWTIDTLEGGTPIVSGTDYKVEVAARNGSDSDISQAEFSILPSIDITAPAAGVSWTMGTTREITWTKTGTQDDYVNITLFKSSTAVLNIGTSLDNSGSFFWDIPGSITPDVDYSIRVETVDGLVLDDSEVFSLLGSIEVTSPAAGVEWLYGNTYSITWDTMGTMNANVKLRLQQNGANIVAISDSTPNDGSYTWTVPATTPEASNYVIMVKTIDSLVFDTSDEFTIAAEGSTASLAVTSPVSSSNWSSGSTQTITWSKTGVQDSNVKIELFKGGSLNSNISLSTANDGSFSWVIDGAQPSGSDYMVRVTTLDDQLTDDSDTFTITLTSPEITVTSPAAGASWTRGSSYTISWNTAGSMDSNVKIELFKGGSLNTTISASTPNDGSFSWPIASGQTLGTDYVVRVTTIDDAVTDDSGQFSIVDQPTVGVTVTSPNSSSQWYHGNTYTITWDRAGTLNANVKLRLQQNGSNIVVITNNTPNDGSYSWTVPGSVPSASNYIIMVKTIDNLYYDESDEFYVGTTIATPTLTLTSPVSSSNWTSGSTQAITWNKTGTQDSNVKIELFKAGSFDSTISASTSNDGSFSWAIDGGQVSGSDYAVRITTIDNAVTDDSETFTITLTSPEITVTSPAAGANWTRGSSYTISWNTAGSMDSDVKIELIKGGTLDTIISASTPNDGSFSWPIAAGQTLGTDYVVRITTSDDAFSDDSGQFSVVDQPTDGIVVTSPNNSSQWFHGNTYTITWDRTGTLNANVKLRLQQNGANIVVITNNTPNDGSYSWTVPASVPSASNYIIMVKTIDNLYYDESDEFYAGSEVVNPTITVTSPISSSYWIAGSTYAITWNTTGTQDANVKIELFKGGSLDSTISPSTPNSGSFTWTIDGAQANGSDYVARVTTLDDQVTDDSAQFEISDTPVSATIMITSPSGNSEWNAGSAQTITWDKSGTQDANVGIVLHEDGGSSSTIISSTPNDGSYSWSLGSGLASGRYYVTVTTADSQVTDDSNMFKIFGTGITVDMPEAGDTIVKGSSVNITWKVVGNMNANVKLRLQQNGVNIAVITNSTANDGSFTWTIPSTITNSDDYVFMVKTIDNLIFDISDLFSIANAGINVTSPSTNNILNRNSQYTINWTKTGSQNANVKLRVFQGGSQILNITDSTANDGTFIWTVPSDLLLATDLVIRVKTIDDLISDDSGLITIED